MLKLLKYEWKACARVLLPLYGAVLLISVVNRLMDTMRADDLLFGIPSVILAMLYFGVLSAVFVVTAVILIQRFYKNLLGDEGYLMFTLPVSVSRHLWSKLIMAMVMSIIGLLAAMLSIGILGSGTGLIKGIGMFFSQLGKAIGRDPNAILFAIEGLIWMLLLGMCGILFIYLCIALGHLAPKHRVLMAVVWYFVLSTAVQFLLSLVLVGLGNLPLEGLYQTINAFINGVGETASVHFGMLGLCVATAVPGAICYGGTLYILKNRLNLE